MATKVAILIMLNVVLLPLVVRTQLANKCATSSSSSNNSENDNDKSSNSNHAIYNTKNYIYIDNKPDTSHGNDSNEMKSNEATY